MKKPICLFFVLLSTICTPAFSQEAGWDSTLKESSHPIFLSKKYLSGPGWLWIKQKAETSQFLAFGETHGRAEIPKLVSIAYQYLYEQGYHYLALEMGPHIAEELSDTENLGRKGRVKRLAIRHPKAIAFAYDHELRMIAAAGKKFKAPGQAIWGLDHAFGAKHLVKGLKRFSVTSAQKAARKTVLRKIRKAGNGHKYLTDADRSTDIHLLRQTFREEQSEAAKRINSLEVSNRIYHNWVKAYRTKEDRLAAYENLHEREELMKSQFLAKYRETQALGVAKPKVIFKFGGAHIEPGIGSNSVTTLGGFIKDFAITEGGKSTTIGMIHISKKYTPKPGSIAAFFQSAASGQMTLFDFSALKDKALSDPELSSYIKNYIMRYDALILIPNSKKAGIGNYIKSKLWFF